MKLKMINLQDTSNYISYLFDKAWVFLFPLLCFILKISIICPFWLRHFARQRLSLRCLLPKICAGNWFADGQTWSLAHARRLTTAFNCLGSTQKAKNWVQESFHSSQKAKKNKNKPKSYKRNIKASILSCLHFVACI